MAFQAKFKDIFVSTAIGDSHSGEFYKESFDEIHELMGRFKKVNQVQ
jgi:hypothetical protein